MANYAAQFKGELFFTAGDGEHGVELWKSDGTETGTVQVKDINPTTKGTLLSVPDGVGYPRAPQWADVDGTLFFAGRDPFRGKEVWKSDGTTAGTVIVKDINPNGNGVANYLVNANGEVFFSGYAGGRGGPELWKTDGTEAGTVLVKDINRVNNFYYDIGPQYLTNVNGTLYFAGDEGNYKRELWKSDGTEAGTVRVKGLQGSDYLSPSNLTDVGGTLFFGSCCRDGYTGLWKSDGTEAGTNRISPVSVVGVSGNVNVNGMLMFSGYNAQFGSELWSSNGTKAGTKMVKEIIPGNEFSPDIGNFTNVDGTLFFTINDGTNGVELWKSDGTADGTQLVKDINPGSSDSKPSNLTEVNGILYFTANDSVNGIELWKSDGTDVGTVLVKNIGPGPASSEPASLTTRDGILYFSADDGTHGAELWQSDGTAEGTVMVSDIRPGAEGSNISHLFNASGKLFFAADDGVNGHGLWVLKPDTVEPPIPGDSNHDGIFNSSDLIKVFQAGEYEDGIPGNSTFEEGDWNNDGDFDSGDLVYVFQQGNYSNAATAAGIGVDSALAAASRRDLTDSPGKPVVVSSKPKTSIPALIAPPVSMVAESIDRVFADLYQDGTRRERGDKHAADFRIIDSAIFEDVLV